MSELKVNTISNASGTNAISIGSDGSLSYPNIGRRNLIINGAMQVAQRGTSATGIGGTSSGYYASDRMYLQTQCAAVFTVEQSTDAPIGFSNSYKITVTTADTSLATNDRVNIHQMFEGQNLQHLGFATSSAKNITLSFWVKSSITGTYTIGGYAPDGGVYYSQQYTIDSANTWEHKTLTIVLPTSGTAIANDNTTGLQIGWNLSMGSMFTSGNTEQWGSNAYWAAGHTANVIGTTNATFQITGVQLEVGSVATPFEHRSYGEELALCKRYFMKYTAADHLGTGNYYSTTDMRLPFRFDVEMRATPSVSTSTDSDSFRLLGNGTSDYFNIMENSGGGSKKGMTIGNWTTVSGTAGTSGYVYVYNTNGYLQFDAEL